MAIYRVDDQSELNEALQRARGGDSILLSAGRYEKLELNSGQNSMRHVKFGSTVTIASEDDARPAVIGSLNVRGAANVEISGVTFDHTGQTGSPFRISESSDITIRDSVFDGHDGRNGFGSGNGLMVSRSSDIVVEDNVTFNFANGFAFSNTSGIVMEGNDVSRMSNDGARFAGVTDVRIEDNTFHDQDSPSSLRHKDAIQFWTSDREGPSREVVIRGNDFTNAEVAHTIFMGNELARTDATKGYRDILVEDNMIRGGHSHGISIEHVNGAVIRGNVLDRAPGVQDRPLYTPIINVGDKSVNVTIVGNEVSSVQRAAGPTWTVARNVITDRQSYEHWLGDAASGSFDRAPSALYRSWVGSSWESAGARTSSLSAAEDEAFRFFAAEAPEPWGDADEPARRAEGPDERFGGGESMRDFGWEERVLDDVADAFLTAQPDLF